ncbi:MAG: DUF4433 domain-containing protein [Cyanobacteria bacterium SIG30]|nr:DUF4433 domain-containing protein [Cyanobacteria bacterium SIG30]
MEKELSKKEKLGDKRLEFDKIFDDLKEKYHFEGFFHTTSFENFVEIMTCKKIFSRAELQKAGIKFSDIALDDVIDKTRQPIKNYVRFYFREKTPTNYDNEGIKPKSVLELETNFKAHSPNPVIMIFDHNIAFDNQNVFFARGNASRNKTKFTNKINQLRDFEWEQIFHNQAIIEENLKDLIINMRNAEIMYPNFISIDKIVKIIFRNVCDYERAIYLFGKDDRFVVDDKYFFNDWLSVKESSLIKNNDNLKLKLCFNLGRNMSKYKLSNFEHKIIIFKGDKIVKKGYVKDIDKRVEYSSFAYPKIADIEIDLNLKDKCDYICYFIDNIECVRISCCD